MAPVQKNSGQKGPQAFRTISETAEAVGAPQHVLRFWETKFAFVQPVKRAGGRRFYRPQDIVLLKAVRRLLHDEGLTIKGVQRLHKDQGLPALAAYGDPGADFVMSAGAATAPDTGTDLRDRGGLSDSEALAPVSARQSDALRAILMDIEAARSRLDAVLAA